MGNKPILSQKINVNISHPRMNSAYIAFENNQRILRSKQGIQQKMFKEWQQYIEKNIKTVYPEFLLIPKKWEYNRVGMCSSAGIVAIDYDDYPYLLVEQVHDKKGRKNIFEESDIWYLLYAITQAKSDISTVSPYLGDIRLQNIFINSNGMIKISNTLSWPNQHSIIQKFRQGQPCYLPPEKVEELKQSKFFDSQGTNSEIFSIGLTLLSVCTLTDLSCLYDTKKYTFDYEEMQKKCNQLIYMEYYSEILKATILNLCSSSPQTRVTFQELHNWMDKHKGKIKSKDSFVINEVPSKWHHQVQLLRENLSIIRSSRNSSPLGPIKGYSPQRDNHIQPIVNNNFILR